jgi:serine/threonine protein kinase
LCCAAAEFAAFQFQQPTVEKVAEENAARARATSERRLEQYYELKEVLGSGSYAVVHKGIEKATGTLYAIKVINKKVCTSSCTHPQQQHTYHTYHKQ